MTGTTALMIGLDPTVIDFARSPFPDLTPEQVNQELQDQADELVAEGFAARWLLLRPDATAADMLTRTLKGERFDIILFGAGVRTIPDYALAFEALINIAHVLAPHSRFCFNSNPADTIDAVKRSAAALTKA
jgi:hypothetical protein